MTTSPMHRELQTGFAFRENGPEPALQIPPDESAEEFNLELSEWTELDALKEVSQAHADRAAALEIELHEQKGARSSVDATVSDAMLASLGLRAQLEQLQTVPDKTAKLVGAALESAEQLIMLLSDAVVHKTNGGRERTTGYVNIPFDLTVRDDAESPESSIDTSEMSERISELEDLLAESTAQQQLESSKHEASKKQLEEVQKKHLVAEKTVTSLTEMLMATEQEAQHLSEAERVAFASMTFVESILQREMQLSTTI